MQFKKKIILLVCLFLLFSLTQSALASDLSDLAEHWAENEIRKLVDLGAITGYPDNTFKPEDSITKAEYSSVLWGVLGLSETEGENFTDIKGHWCQGRIEALISEGIIDTEVYSKKYKPDKPITRQEIAMMVARMLDLDNVRKALSFKDVNKVGAEFYNYVVNVFDKEIITGYPDNTFRPEDTATRAEAAVMIIRALDTAGLVEPEPTAEETTKEPTKKQDEQPDKFEEAIKKDKNIKKSDDPAPEPGLDPESSVSTVQTSSELVIIDDKISFSYFNQPFVFKDDTVYFSLEEDLRHYMGLGATFSKDNSERVYFIRNTKLIKLNLNNGKVTKPGEESYFVKDYYIDHNDQIYISSDIIAKEYDIDFNWNEGNVIVQNTKPDESIELSFKKDKISVSQHEVIDLLDSGVSSQKIINDPDVTEIHSKNPEIVSTTCDNKLFAKSPGKTNVIVELGEQRKKLEVEVKKSSNTITSQVQNPEGKIQAQKYTEDRINNPHEKMVKHEKVIKNVKEIVEDAVTPDMSDAEKQLALQIYLAENMDYCHDYENIHIHDFFLNKKGICATFSEAYSFLLKEVGIESKIVKGKCRTQGPHAWNLVKLDGDYYHVDPTWNTSNSTFIDPKNDFNYYNLTDFEMQKTHIWAQEQYPPARGIDYRINNVTDKLIETINKAE